MIWLWVGFILFVCFMLALDLGVFNRKAHVVSAKEAVRWVIFFIALALVFNVAVYFIYSHNWLGIGTKYRQGIAARITAPDPSHGHAPQADPHGTTIDPALTPAPALGSTGTGEAGLLDPGADGYDGHRIGMRAAAEFFAGWLTEYSLSIDNIFVISLLFTFFSVPAKYQHRVLFWGILGALVMRGIMIGLGTEIVKHAEWVLLFFGLFLLVQGIKLMKPSDKEFDPEKSKIIRLTRRIIPVTNQYHEQKFLTRIDGRLYATPLFLVLIIVEATDVVFAVDSIPAIFGITRDPFLIFTSNVFAIMGLRSLYFALASMLNKFHYLHYSLAVILAGVGVKMLVENGHHARALMKWLPDSMHWLVTWVPDHAIHVPTALSLGVIIGSLLLGVLTSLLYAERHPETAKPDPTHDDKHAH